MHVAFLSPLGYAFAHKRPVSRAILAEERRDKISCTACLRVCRDSGIQKFDNLKGKTVSFNDPLSVPGYLFPSPSLCRRVLKRPKLRLALNHQTAKLYPSLRL